MQNQDIFVVSNARGVMTEKSYPGHVSNSFWWGRTNGLGSLHVRDQNRHSVDRFSGKIACARSDTRETRVSFQMSGLAQSSSPSSVLSKTAKKTKKIDPLSCTQYFLSLCQTSC